MAVNISQPNTAEEMLRGELFPYETIFWSGQPGLGGWKFDAVDIVRLPIALFILVIGLVRVHMSMSVILPITTRQFGPESWVFFRYILPISLDIFLPILLLLVFLHRPLRRRMSRRYTYYAVTNDRVIAVVQERLRRDVRYFNISEITNIDKQARANGVGTVTFRLKDSPVALPPLFRTVGTGRSRGWWENPPPENLPLAFEDISDTDKVYELVNSLRPATLLNRQSLY